MIYAINFLSFLSLLFKINFTIIIQRYMRIQVFYINTHMYKRFYHMQNLYIVRIRPYVIVRSQIIRISFNLVYSSWIVGRVQCPEMRRTVSLRFSIWRATARNQSVIVCRLLYSCCLYRITKRLYASLQVFLSIRQCKYRTIRLGWLIPQLILNANISLIIVSKL